MAFRTGRGSLELTATENVKKAFSCNAFSLRPIRSAHVSRELFSRPCCLVGLLMTTFSSGWLTNLVGIFISKMAWNSALCLLISSWISIALHTRIGKIGRAASEHVVVELLKTKCLPVLLYGLEACSLSKAQIRSLDYAVSSCYRTIFNASCNEKCPSLYGYV